MLARLHCPVQNGTLIVMEVMTMMFGITITKGTYEIAYLRRGTWSQVQELLTKLGATNKGINRLQANREVTVNGLRVHLYNNH